MAKNALIFVISALLVLSLCACAEKNEVKETDMQTTKSTENMMPDFTVYTADNKAVTLHEKLKKPVVVNFWATWCPPCQSEMPAFNELYKEYGKDVEFMMIDLTDGERDTVESVKAFLSEKGYDFPVYYDTQMNAASVYGVSSIPMTLFIDEDGNLLNYKVGAISEDELKMQLESMVK